MIIIRIGHTPQLVRLTDMEQKMIFSHPAHVFRPWTGGGKDQLHTRTISLP